MNRLLSLLLALTVLAVITLGWERVWNVQRPASVETSLRLVQDYCTASTPEEREKAWEAVLASAKAQKLFLNIDLPLDDGLTCALSQEH